MKIRLNLGSGEIPLAGYENLDRKNGKEVYPLVSYADNSVDEIRASHILEHFGRLDTFKVLQNWASKLKIGGVLKVAVPDFSIIADQYVKGNKDPRFDVGGFICGGQVDADDYHKAIFDRPGLEAAFRQIGLDDIRTWTSDAKDCASLPISLNLQGTKRQNGQMPLDNTDWRISVLKEQLHPAIKEIVGHAKNIYSQFGEDGVVDAIFERIGIKNKCCLEVGAADGILFSNTRRLVEAGWDAILVEKDPDQYKKLADNCEKYPNVEILNRSVSADPRTGVNLDEVLDSFSAPEDIDLVCIDIDGQDWHVWNQMIDYRPRVIMIEYNPAMTTGDWVPSIDGGGQAGIDAIMKLAVSKGYHSIMASAVNAICIRDEDAELLLQISPETAATETDPDKPTNIVAVMSMPRLAFTDNIFSGMAAFTPLGITFERGTGVFWGQVLTRMITKHLGDGTDYIITTDYDTYYTKNQVIRLIQLAVENPEADAICTLQAKRECDNLLIAKTEADGTYSKTITLDADLLSVDSGHFGLTIFKASAFAKMKKPWFIGVPNPDGEWGEGRQDEDVYFWSNFKEAGLRLFLAHQIGIGHLQMMCTFPGRSEDNWRPTHEYMNDVHKNGVPRWCEPKTEMLK